MVSTIDEEDIPYYRNLEETDHAFPQVSSPTESHRRGASQPNLYINEWVDHSSRSLPHLGHRRGVSHPANTYRDYGLETSNDAFRYLTAGDRRRSSLPEIYNNNGPQTSRSSVLRAIFTPRVSEIEDLEDTHSPLYIMLHPRSGAWYSEIFKKFISTLIIGDLLAFVISTEDSIYQQHWIWFQAIEGITASIFLVEYIARVTVSVENKKFGIHGPVLGRIRWMTTFHAIIDILATAPFFIQVLTGHPMPRLTYLRIFRVLRIMKTDSYARAFSACYRVVYFNREILWVAVLICFFLIVTSSVLLYYCRPRDGEDDDIEFQSIPSTLYLSVLILTGQDSFIRSSQTMPWYTKMVVGLTGALSVALYAIPVSLLTWGFEAEAERCARKARADIKRQKSMANSTVDRVDSMNSDEEYLKIIAKDTSESGTVDVDKRTEKIKELMDAYMKDDPDGRKYFALADFLANAGYRDDSFFDSIGRAEPEPTLHDEISILKYRVENTEMALSTINSKLDRLCNLLETQIQPENVIA